MVIFYPYYRPGFKGGGPVKSIEGIVENLPDVRFTIVSNDRDLGDLTRYEDATSANGQKGRAAIKWVRPSFYHSFLDILASTNRASIDGVVIYLNTILNFKYTFLPLLFLAFRRHKGRIVVAPRGVFSPGAFRLGGIKKILFLRIIRVVSWQLHLEWHFTASDERREAFDLLENSVKWDVSNCRHFVVPNISTILSLSNVEKNLEKKSRNTTRLNIIFIARIVPKKNLLGALLILQHVTVLVRLNIYGPKEDLGYWKKCSSIIDNLPSNVSVEYCGFVSPEQLSVAYSESDLMLFPTLGENYGHTIVEAVCHGVPVIISDKTPWVECDESSVVTVVDSSDVMKCATVIDRFDKTSLKSEDFAAYYQKYISEPNIRDMYYDMFLGQD